MEFANAAALRAARRMMFALREGMTDLGGRGGCPPAWAAALLLGLRRHRRPCRPQPLEFQGRDPAPGSPASFGIAHHGADICPRLHRRWLGGSPRRGAEHDRGLRRPLFRGHGGLVRRGTIGRPGQASLEAHDVAPSSRPVRGDAEPRPTYRLGQMEFPARPSAARTSLSAPAWRCRWTGSAISRSMPRHGSRTAMSSSTRICAPISPCVSRVPPTAAGPVRRSYPAPASTCQRRICRLPTAARS